MKRISGNISFVYKSGKFVEATGISSIALKVAYRFDEFKEKGGMIVCSTDINSNQEDGIKGKLKSIFLNSLNRLLYKGKIDETIKPILIKYGINIGWSVGKLFNGRYYDRKNDKLFSEKSFSIDMRGVSMDIVREVALAICEKFDQQSVLLINHETNRSGLLYP